MAFQAFKVLRVTAVAAPVGTYAGTATAPAGCNSALVLWHVQANAASTSTSLKLEGSDDNSSWTTINTATRFPGTQDAGNTWAWIVGQTNYAYYRVSSAGGGTTYAADLVMLGFNPSNTPHTDVASTWACTEVNFVDPATNPS